MPCKNEGGFSGEIVGIIAQRTAQASTETLAQPGRNGDRNHRIISRMRAANPRRSFRGTGQNRVRWR